MKFSEQKLINIRPQKERKLLTFLLGLLISALFFAPYIIADGGYFAFFGDYNVQQIPFYQLCHKAVKEGNIAWSYTTDLGANFIGSYSFYLLGSPFFWLTIPFPNSFVPYLLAPLFMLKFAFASLTAYLYIRRFTRYSLTATLTSLLYAFSGFSIFNIFFNHFHEPLIFFPLLLLALELLITENRRGVFALMVAVCAVVNYFFFFGMVVFCAIYFFVRVFSGAIRVKISRFLVVLLEAIVGLGLSCFLLLPSLAAIADNSRVSETLLGWSAITYGKEQIYLNILECFFFPPDLPARPVFFPGANVKWSSLGGWLPVFSTVGVFTLFKTRKGSWLKRLIGICLFMSLVPILNSAFYAFNQSYYARWFYMPVLMLCLATAVMAEDLSADWSYGFKWVFGITAAASLVIGLFPQRAEDGSLIYGLYTQDSEDPYALRYWVTCAIALVSLIILYFLLKIRKKDMRAFLKAGIACVCAISVIYANVFIATGRSYSYDIKEEVIPNLIEGEVELEGEDFFRIDTYDGIDNTAMYLGYPSINAFHSIVPASITEFYDYLGIERTVGSRPDTEAPALRSLLSVKYLLNRTAGESFIDDEGEPLMSGFHYTETQNGYYVYENENYLPMGFAYDYYLTEEYLEDRSADVKTRYMLKGVLLNKNQIKKYGDILESFEDAEELAEQEELQPFDTDSGVTASEQAAIPSIDSQAASQNEAEAVEQSNKTADSLSAEQETDLAVTEEPEKEEEQPIFALTDERLKLDCEALRENAVSSFKTENGRFTAKISRENASLVFFSVPYDEGWSATVNGKDVNIEKVNKGFMAVAVPAGDSTIRFTYKTPALGLGIKISLGSLAVFLIYFLVSAVYLKSRPDRSVYPEGDELIARWHKDDITEETMGFFDDEDDFKYEPKSILIDDDITESISFENTDYNGGFKIDTDDFQ